MVQRRRDTMLQIRLTNAERDYVRSAANAADACSVTEWVLAAALVTHQQPQLIAAAAEQIRRASDDAKNPLS